MDDEIQLTVSCHCKQHKYSFKIPKSSLPIHQKLCHCNISRRISGCLFTSYFPIPLLNTPPNTTGLTAYKSSDILSRYFCSTCSTHLYLQYTSDGHWEASHGSVESKTDGIFAFVGNWWIGDTRDGGGSVWLREFGGERMKRYLTDWGNSEEVPLSWRADETKTTESRDGNSATALVARCHCNGVRFCISRPNEESLKASSPYSDLIVPYYSARSAENPDNEPWWLRADHTKYFAGNCACDSCREIAGFDIQSWAFVPIANISIGDRKPLTLPFGTIKSYHSSTNGEHRRVRWFCSCCGANVFWSGSERPSVIDVAVGILDAPSGTRAEEWLEWCTSRVSFREDAHNEHLVETLERGLKEWQLGK